MILAQSILVSTKGDTLKNTLYLQARHGLEGATTFSITTLSIMTLSIISFFETVSINDAQHKWYYIESCYAVCRYVECHCAECRGAAWNTCRSKHSSLFLPKRECRRKKFYNMDPRMMTLDMWPLW